MNSGKFDRIRLRIARWLQPLALILIAGPVAAQSFSVGADFVSRYVFRGTDFGEAASVQPAFSFATGGLEVGTWASYAIVPDAAAVNEHDVWFGYTVETPSAGSFTFGITDYYFPTPDGVGFFEFDGNGRGAHWVEPYGSYTFPGSIPVTLYGAVFYHNDPDHSLYMEASLPLKVDGVDLEMKAGAVGAGSDLYGTEGFAFVNLALAVSKPIQVTEKFEIPISVAYILNPDAERSYLVFGVSL